MIELAPDLRTPLTELLLSVADDKFMLGHRNADWTGLAPMLEEDIAFSSLAQDDLAHAMALYEFLAELNGGRADAIAYGRPPEAYRCCALVELHDGFDWSLAIARQFLCDHFEQVRLSRLAAGSYEPLRVLAVRLLAEERLAIGHADQWVIRLGSAPGEARAKIQAALTRLAPLAAGLFEPTADVERLESSGIYPPPAKSPFDQWSAAVENVLSTATLQVSFPRQGAVGGRRGARSAEFAALHAELTEVYRLEPEASW